MAKKAAKKWSEGNPLMAFRLKAETRRKLDRMTKGLGYQESSAFLREFIEVVISSDPELMNAFVGRMAKRAQEQLQAQIPGLLDAPIGPKRRARG